MKLTDQQIAGMTRQQLIDRVRAQEQVVEAARHASHYLDIAIMAGGDLANERAAKHNIDEALAKVPT